MDAKLNLILTKPNQLASVTSNMATSQHVGEGAEKEPKTEKEFENLNTKREYENIEIPIDNKIQILKVVIRNPYHTRNMEKANAAKGHLEKKMFGREFKRLQGEIVY